MPAVRTRRVTLASLGPPSVPGAVLAGGLGGGQTTCQDSGPERRCSPVAACRTGMRRALACRRTNSACSAGSSRAVVSIAPTVRPRSTPGSPATWSAWKWVSRTRARG